MLHEPERWKLLLLCDKASTEQDPRKLATLISQICNLLEKFEKKESHPDGNSDSDSDKNAYLPKSAAG